MTADGRRCRGRTADGTACGAPPELVAGTGFCRNHDPALADERARAARKGGEATARRYRREGLDPEELPRLDSPQAAETWLEAVGRAVATGRLGHNEGRTVVASVREFLRAHDAGTVSERIKALTDALADWRKTGDPEAVLKLVDGGR